MVMRIGGLASGMDIDQIVKDLMKVERVKIDKLEQSKTLSTWKQEIYNERNKDLANFIIDTKKEFGLTSTSSSGTLINKSVSSLTWVKSVASSDTSVASATSRADSVAGTYNITVDQLASNWSSASSGMVSSGDKGNLASQFGLANGDNINFTITTNKGFVNINKTNLSNVKMEDIVKEINSANIGVTAVYDSNIDRFFLQTQDTGVSNTINFLDESKLADDTSFNFLSGTTSKLKLQHIEGGTNKDVIIDGTKTYTGGDAKIDFGAAADIIQSSNQFTINGISLDLKSIGNTTVTVNTDIDAVFNKIKAFVDQYNSLIGKISEEVSEKRYRDFLPLSQEQKESMSEDDIKLWEEKAKSGLLRNDSNLERTLQSMRSGMYQAVEGVTGSYVQITEIGITTEGYLGGSKGGKLIIDESKLKSAIQQDVDGVLELLFKDSGYTGSESNMSSSDIADKRSKSGLINRLYDNVIVGMKDIINKSGTGNNSELYRNVSSTLLLDFVTKQGNISYLDKEIDDFESSLIKMNDYLASREESYYRKFTAMEKALSEMYAQSDWISQQLG